MVLKVTTVLSLSKRQFLVLESRGFRISEFSHRCSILWNPGLVQPQLPPY